MEQPLTLPEKALERITYQTIRSTANPAMLIDESGRFIWFNKAFTKTLGYSEKDLEKMCIWDMDENFTKDSWPGFWDEFLQKSIFNVITIHTKKTGEKINVQMIIHKIEYDDKTLLFSYSQNITEFVQAKKALSDSEEKYRMLTETSNDAIFIVGKDLNINFVNNTGASYLFSTPADIIGKPVDCILPPEDADKYKAKILKIIKKGRAEKFDIKFKLPDGKRWFNIRIIPLKSNDPGDTLVFIYASDINERKDTKMPSTLQTKS
mgnify:FL=1